MKEFKGTNGEWFVSGDMDNIWIHTGKFVETSTGIANVKCYDNQIPRYEESKHNAKLIAAAPELLKATQLVYDMLSPITNQWEGRNTEAGQYVLSFLESAINKALD